MTNNPGHLNAGMRYRRIDRKIAGGTRYDDTNDQSDGPQGATYTRQVGLRILGPLFFGPRDHGIVRLEQSR